jgi:hypothetical protein
MKNKTLEVLAISDNDFGVDGGQIIGKALG